MQYYICITVAYLAASRSWFLNEFKQFPTKYVCWHKCTDLLKCSSKCCDFKSSGVAYKSSCVNSLLYPIHIRGSSQLQNKWCFITMHTRIHTHTKSLAAIKQSCLLSKGYLYITEIQVSALANSPRAGSGGCTTWYVGAAHKKAGLQQDYTKILPHCQTN